MNVHIHAGVCSVGCLGSGLIGLITFLEACRAGNKSCIRFNTRSYRSSVTELDVRPKSRLNNVYVELLILLHTAGNFIFTRIKKIRQGFVFCHVG
jgi:hypothetical protein